MIAKSTAGMAMNVYSTIGLPCDCSGIGWPRSLKRITTYRTVANTSRPTMPAMRKTHHWRSWMIWALSPAGFQVSWGASLAHDDSATMVPSATAGAPRRRSLRGRDELSPEELSPEELSPEELAEVSTVRSSRVRRTDVMGPPP